MAQVQTKTSTVDQAAILRQAVLNTSQSIELLREAVSNSVDADARSIDIKLAHVGGDEWNITILDDGHGMEQRHMEAFFNAGQTEKDYSQSLVIGEKGLGSKTSFVAKQIVIESRRRDNPTSLLVGTMADPLKSLRQGHLPEYTIERDPESYAPGIQAAGTCIQLRHVVLTKFNGKRTGDPAEIASRVLHYLRSMCATGTVKNRHAHKQHISRSVMNVGVIPNITVEVVSTSDVTLGPESGAYAVPTIEVSPSKGPEVRGIVQASKNYADVYDFSGSKTLSVRGEVVTVHYDGTAIVAGENVRDWMLRGEMKQGWTHKSQMGLHLCKDFIPLKSDGGLSRELLGGEYYYNFKVFLNCQSFELNADRSAVTNLDSDEVAWIFEDFKATVWPNLEAKAASYKRMVDEEENAIIAIKKTEESQELKAHYGDTESLVLTGPAQNLKFVKAPRKEADVSHLLAMMLQSGIWETELKPLVKFGRYIDASTDVLAENAAGEPLLVEIEFHLSNLFKHKHPMNSYDVVAVWSLAGLTNGDAFKAPWGKNGSDVPVTLMGDATGGWALKWGTHQRPLIVLSDLLAVASKGA